MGLKDPDPRQQILSDLLDLIDEKRSRRKRRLGQTITQGARQSPQTVHVSGKPY